MRTTQLGHTRSLATSAVQNHADSGVEPRAGPTDSLPADAAQNTQSAPSPLGGLPMQLSAAEQQQQQLQSSLPKPPLAIRGVCKRKNLPLGWKKIDFVLPLARRRLVDDAMAQLEASPRKGARLVMHAVANARGNAIYAGGPLADPSRLLVEEAFVTKGRYTKQLAIMGRGYSSIMLTRRSHLTVTVRQLEQGEAPPRVGRGAGRSRRGSRDNTTRMVAPLQMRRPWWSSRRSRMSASPPSTSMASASA